MGSPRSPLSRINEKFGAPPPGQRLLVTMYKLPTRNRYLINSPMLLQLVKDANGGLTLYVQNESPGNDKKPNWLPAPKGPFLVAMRLYWPKDKALDGAWK